MRSTDARVFGRFIPVIALSAAVLFQLGCAGSTRIDGRVVTGPVGMAIIAEPGDERLESSGVPGVEVALLRETTSSGGALITQTVTDEEGNFRMTLARGKHPGNAVIVRTRGDGIYTSRSRSYLPRGSQKLLCTVIPQPPSERQEPAADRPGAVRQ